VYEDGDYLIDEADEYNNDDDNTMMTITMMKMACEV
jgi:hypothetical protein